MPVSENLSSEVRAALTDYRAVTSIPVEWGNMDAFGHVNNIVYIRWFESARIDLLHTVRTSVTMGAGGVGPILASITCDYKRQLHFPDTVHIGSRVSRIGRSSMDVEHAVFSEKLGETAAIGRSVLVVFDYEANRPVRIPEDLRQALQN